MSPLSENGSFKVLYCKQLHHCSNFTDLKSYTNCIPYWTVIGDLLRFLKPTQVQFYDNCKQAKADIPTVPFDMIARGGPFLHRSNITYVEPFGYAKYCAMYNANLDIISKDTKSWYFASPLQGIMWYIIIPVMIYEFVVSGFRSRQGTSKLKFVRDFAILHSFGALIWLYNADFTATQGLAALITPKISSVARLNTLIKNGVFQPILDTKLSKWDSRYAHLKSSSNPDYKVLLQLLENHFGSQEKIPKAKEICKMIYYGHRPESGKVYVTILRERILLNKCAPYVHRITKVCLYEHAYGYKYASTSRWIEKINHVMPALRAIRDSLSRRRKGIMRLNFPNNDKEPTKVVLGINSIDKILKIYAATTLGTFFVFLVETYVTRRGYEVPQTWDY